MDSGLLRPATLPQVIVEVMDIGILRPSTLSLVILGGVILVMLVEVDIGQTRPDTLLVAIREKELMLKGKLDIGLSPATIPTITHMTVVYC